MDKEIRSFCALDWGKHGEALKVKLLKVVRATPVIYPERISYREPEEWPEEITPRPAPTSQQLKADYNTFQKKFYQHLKEHKDSYKKKGKLSLE